ncbi:WD40 repeat domain-containing protein [Acinetobacter lwoffii]|uniref:WD40 repeat domain-containing protein n=1 Tax=Acinetobacter lwoffii TaxID=28090 RepID=A0A6N1MSW4_ACILW|nr:WD40 repeat domain-containing protein [Acinetobacter lwoffii]QKU21711.1 WD40 repeat domain-containing protein [Acinetobacter lwoffii]
MRKVTLINSSSQKKVVDLTLRQGLLPLEHRNDSELYNGGSLADNSQQGTLYTPDMQKCISKNQSSNSQNNYSVCRDIRNSTLMENPLAVFAGVIQEVDASNTHFAVGGANPFLYVFDWASLSLQSASTAGLGTVNSLRFSPEGSLLAVSHATSPFIRIYKTSDWSYIEPTAAENASITYVVEFSNDGTKLIARAGSNPSFRVFSTQTGARIFSQHIAFHTTDANSTRGFLYQHPTKNNLVFSLGTSSSSSGPRSYVFNTDTLVLEPISALPSINQAMNRIYGIYFNDLDNSITLSNSLSSINYLARFNADTYEPMPIPEIDTLYKYYSPQYKFFSNLCKYDTSRITGVVRDINNLPARRMVRAYRRSDGALMAQTFSDAVTGQYKLLLPDTEFYDVQFLTEDGEQLNDLFFAKSIPEQV